MSVQPQNSAESPPVLNGASILLVISCEKSLPTLQLVELIPVLFVVRQSESLRMISVRIKRRKNDYQQFFCNPDVFRVSRGRRLSRLSMERELGIIASWLET